MGRSLEMTVVVARELSELENHVSDWEKLAASAIEPNIFYEPWFLMPAVAAFAKDQRVEFVFIYADDPGFMKGPKILCGFFPLERRDRYHGLPVSVVSLWKHSYCFLCTPLVKAGYGTECMEALFEWLNTDAGSSSLMEFCLIRADGPFRQLLVETFNARTALTYTPESHTRALFCPATDAEQYLSNALPLKQLKGLKRREAQLGATGKLNYISLERDGDVQSWTAGFLEVEAGGWKGKEGSALACNEDNRTFFNAITTAAFQRDRLVMLALYLDERPIAYRCSLLAEPGAFSFKIAYDEAYARYSPGVLLHLENIRYLHSRAEIRWMDSCTSPDNSMLNHLWTDRRALTTLVVGTGRSSGDLVVATLPLLRWLKRKLKRQKSES